MAVLYGADKEDAEKEMKDVLDFEIAFAKVRNIAIKFYFKHIFFSTQITQSKEERRDVTKLYNLITVSELQMMFPCLHWVMNFFIDFLK